jgi:hypothetical protein
MFNTLKLPYSMSRSHHFFPISACRNLRNIPELVRRILAITSIAAMENEVPLRETRGTEQTKSLGSFTTPRPMNTNEAVGKLPKAKEVRTVKEADYREPQNQGACSKPADFLRPILH